MGLILEGPLKLSSKESTIPHTGAKDRDRQAALSDFDGPLEDLIDHDKKILRETDPLLLDCLVFFCYLLFFFILVL